MAGPDADAAEADTRHEAEPEAPPKGFTEQDVEHIEEHARLRAPEIYEIVRREGETEIQRPLTSLWWSGLAAGLSISFSLLTEAVFRRHVPDGAWRPLVVSLGYPVGFLMVVLARQQLFTENTITAVLPVAAQFTARNLMLLARNWSVVFGANLVGALVAALFCSFTPVIAPELRDSMLAVSRHVMASGWWGMLCGGIAAGYLIAAMVWLIPSAESAQFLVIVVMTWLIAAGGFKHIVAGSVDAFMLVANGEMGIAHMITGFTIPVLIGNVIGGTALFALIAYAQIMKEV